MKSDLVFCVITVLLAMANGQNSGPPSGTPPSGTPPSGCPPGMGQGTAPPGAPPLPPGCSDSSTSSQGQTTNTGK